MDHIRELPFAVAVAILFVIVMLRANATYWLGRAAVHGGRRSSRVGRSLSGRRMERAERLVSRFGVVAVPLSFLTIGIQTAVNFTAGFTSMPLRRYLPAVTVGCVLWALLYASVGAVGLEVLWQLMRGGVG